MSDPHPATLLRLLNISSLPAQPWKNGGGTTREVVLGSGPLQRALGVANEPGTCRGVV